MAKKMTGSSVGIVVTPRAIVAVQASAHENEIEVKVRGAVETPPETLSGQEVLDPLRLGHALRNLWRRIGLGEHAASVAVLAPSYGLRALRMPQAPERERNALVRGELEQAQVIPQERGAFDFLWIASGEPGVPQADVYAYHINETIIDGLHRSFQVAGLRLASVEPGSIALMRLYLATRGKRDPVAILCPSARHTDLCIHDGTRVRQLRRIPAGWEDLGTTLERGTRDIIPEPRIWDAHVPSEKRGGMLNLSEGESLPEEAPDAEGTLANEASPPAEPTFQGIPNTWPIRSEFSDEVPDILSIGAGQSPVGGQSAHKSDFLVSEISRTLAFFEREHPEEAHPQEIVVLGPTDAARGFERVLSPAQSLPIVVANPLAGLDLPRAVAVPGLEEDPEAYALAVGVALAASGVDLGIPPVDLSRQTSVAQPGRRVPHLLRAGMAWSTLWLLASAIAAIGLMIAEARLADTHVQLTNEIARIHAERAPLIRAAELTKAAESARQVSEIPAAPVLGRVAAATTTGVGLTSLRVAPDGRVMLEGKALGTSNIQRFALSVGRGKSVRVPVIETTKRDTHGYVTFRIGALFREPAPPPPPATGKE